MITRREVIETNEMIQKENLDVRTITMGISLLDCMDADLDKCCEKIHDKIYNKAKNLVKTGKDIEKEFGIPIVNKRISVTVLSVRHAAKRLRILLRLQRRWMTWQRKSVSISSADIQHLSAKEVRLPMSF